MHFMSKSIFVKISNRGRKTHWGQIKLNYTKFVTIIRQICKKNEIPFSNTIKYDKSTYNIIYYIYLVNDNIKENTSS